MNKNKKHYNKWGDPLPELRDALAVELEKMYPEQMFKEPYKRCREIWLFKAAADDIIKVCPDNITLSVNDGILSLTREDVKPDNYTALTGDALSEYTKDQGPADLQELFKRGLESSNFKAFIQ